MASGGVNIKVEKLEGQSTWPALKRQIELLLKVNKCHQAIESEDEEVDEDLDNLASLVLIGNLSEKYISLTSTCESAKEIWIKLRSIFEQTSEIRLDRLLENFFNLKKEANEDITSLISRVTILFKDINVELKKIYNVELPELIVINRILCALPEDFNDFKKD